VYDTVGSSDPQFGGGGSGIVAFKDVLLAVATVAVPVATVSLLPHVPALRPAEPIARAGSRFPPSPVAFERRPLTVPGEEGHLPLVTHVQVVDLDGDGTAEVVACDALGHRLLRFDRGTDGEWAATTVAEDLHVPAHATVVDIDGDGDLDIVVAILGDILPSDADVGRVELLERTATGYVRRVLLDDVRRVADVQAGDLDGDGHVDLAVAVFGYSRGEVLWLRNRGDGTFAPRQLLSGAGAIHVPVRDLDGDGDLDIATIMSQDDEELWGLENLGDGRFERRLLWRTANFDLGSAGLVAADLDGDGDDDLVLPVGDNLEDFDAYPQPYHGCLWFENEGGWSFRPRRIAELGGTYAAAVGDIDGDGRLDVALASMDNDWRDPEAAALVWLGNGGRAATGGDADFRPWQIDTDPIHLITVAVGDIDGDGRADLVAGGLNLRRPYRRIAGVTAWLNRGGTP
jgi:hypothetical protein